jgi:glycosyltransferase involved in cell wall biosynthesis
MEREYQLLSIITPIYNEKEMLSIFFEVLMPILYGLGNPFELICVNDGSQDQTLPALLQLQKIYPEITIIDLYKNFGKEAALTAGMEFAQGDIVIPIDADLQDPPKLIPKLIAKWREGYDMVIGVRICRKTDGIIKRMTAQLFYKIFNKISECKVHYNAGDFRLIDRNVIDVILTMNESSRFMKGLYAWADNGKTTTIEYSRVERAQGKSKWNYWQLWNYAIDGITSFSSLPLRVWSYSGFCLAIMSLLYMLMTLVKTLIWGNHVAGYASLMCVVLFLGGIQLLSLGVLGEYVSRIYLESKKRPNYLIKKCYSRTNDITVKVVHEELTS